MKKALVFVISIFILFAGCIHYAYQRSFDLAFEVKDIKGSSELLKPISLRFAYGIANHKIDLQLIHGEFHYEINGDKNGYHLQKGYLPTDADEKDALGTQRYYLGNIILDEASQWRSTYANCNIQSEDLADINIDYFFTTWKDYEYRTRIQSDIEDHSNEYYDFQKYDITCPIYETTDQIELLEKRVINDQYPSGLFFDTNQNLGIYARYLDHNNYYFVPPLTQTMTGQNHIYHITVNQYGGKYEAIADLPFDRLYETMMIVGDKLVVFSHDKNGFYISKYRQDGTLEDETVVEYQYQKGEAYTLMYKDARYLFWNMGDVYRIFDTESMKFVDQYQIKDNIYSLQYLNGILYTLGEGSTSDSWYIKAYQNQELIYQGECSMPVDGLDHTGVIDYGSFIL